MEAIIDAYERDWRAFREEETGTRQLKAVIIRHVCVCVCVSREYSFDSYKYHIG